MGEAPVSTDTEPQLETNSVPPWGGRLSEDDWRSDLDRTAAELNSQSEGQGTFDPDDAGGAPLVGVRD